MSGAPSGFNGRVIKGVGGSGRLLQPRSGQPVRAATGGMGAAAWGRNRLAKTLRLATLGTGGVSKVIRKK